MKKMFFFSILFFTIFLCSAQRTVYESEVFNGYENPNTVLTLELDEYGAYFLSSRTESGDTNFGRLCIGYDITEAKKTMERVQYFIEHDDLEYILIHTGENIFLKLFKEEDCTVEIEDSKFEIYTFFTTYITDGTDICLTLPEQFVKKARKKII